VAQYPGRYLCIGAGSFGSNATGRRSVSLKVNGTTEYTDANITVPAAAGAIRVESSRLIFLNVGDYVEAVLFQDSGSTLTCTGSLQIIWIVNS
jgi:hypothetical protein